ncbi:unnamed protein product [Microthlaspi erraticum]|uniref:Uncharacterized protein n=1 Tax=Microthlaspi erraticum TaxID=1685480 RepID=A0A6D2KRW3_9BRAS|nr:unnamed protein product [Microthlaspi erraticum]
MKSEASETNYDWLDLGTEPFRKGSRLGKDPEATTSLSAAKRVRKKGAKAALILEASGPDPISAFAFSSLEELLQLTRFPSASRRKLAKLVLSPPSRQAYHRVQQLSISTYLCGTRTGGLQSQTKLGEDENPIIHPVEVENGRVNTNNGRVNPLLVPGAEAPVTNAATTAPMQDFAVRIAATQAPHHQRRTSYPYWTNPFPDDDKKYHGNRL